MPEGILASLLFTYGYIALVPGIIFFGPLAGLLAGVLSRLDFFELGIAYAVLLSAALVADCAWYWAGYHYGESFVVRYGRYVGLNHEHLEKVKRLFEKHHSPIIFFTKVTNAFGLLIPVLFAAGLARISFPRFVALNFAGEAIWTGVMVAIGYFFGELYLQVDDYLGRTIIIGLLVVSAGLMYGFGTFVRRRFYDTIG